MPASDGAAGAPPLGVILAGGLARRMGGGDKGLLRLGGATILVWSSGGSRRRWRGWRSTPTAPPDRFASLGLPVVPDVDDSRAGPLAGVLGGPRLGGGGRRRGDRHGGRRHAVPAARPGGAAELRGAERRRVDRAGGDPRGGPPRPASDLRALARGPARRPRTALASGTRKVVAWTDPHGAATAEFTDSGAFFNVNTPDDLDTARRMAAEQA